MPWQDGTKKAKYGKKGLEVGGKGTKDTKTESIHDRMGVVGGLRKGWGMNAKWGF